MSPSSSANLGYCEDASVPGQRRPDITIAIMGSTGTGKSSLIKLITGDQNIKIGHSVESETSDIGLFRYFEPDGRCIIFVDTPGFDDSREGITDTVILKRISAFLDAEFKDKRLLSGVIYMHRITDPRMGGVSTRNLRMFKKLCGSDSLKNVVIVTSRWDQVDGATGIAREQELLTNTKFFKPLVDAGARSLRHDNTLTSAQNILTQLLDNDPIALQIQVELAQGMPLDQTASGSELSAELKALKEKHEAEMMELREEMAVAIQENDDQCKRELEEEREKLQQQLDQWKEDKIRLEEGLESVKASAEAEKVIAARQLDEQRSAFLAMLEEERTARTHLESEVEKRHAAIEEMRGHLHDEQRRREEFEKIAAQERQALAEQLLHDKEEADRKVKAEKEAHDERMKKLKAQLDLERQTHQTQALRDRQETELKLTTLLDEEKERWKQFEEKERQRRFEETGRQRQFEERFEQDRMTFETRIFDADQRWGGGQEALRIAHDQLAEFMNRSHAQMGRELGGSIPLVPALVGETVCGGIGKALDVYKSWFEKPRGTTSKPTSSL